ncbi:unnamed protein product [Acanthoscelides obtectus]|uniref:Uncharacterized protein n=1 Tax=Acanthoscelides obtectus TaxID=200917 RepID=A0A9P0PBX3_ACAOB|nr:unnamed protein product [Acanthoscelides obtectus]CAK1672426.1 hypothetical protein AOBTE_LOCUS28880 [Acanthoscelides obtectus]
MHKTGGDPLLLLDEGLCTLADEFPELQQCIRTHELKLALSMKGLMSDVTVTGRKSSYVIAEVVVVSQPIKFLFKKENADLVRNTEKEIITKIENLIPIEIKTKEGHSYIIEIDMMLTMLDGSVGNVLSETNSTMKCIICGATPKDMNTLAGINRPPNVCGPENKAIVEANKKRIQAEFRAKLSLIVDKPKPGYGSSNDGNTTRIFFHNPQTSSDITGVDRELIEKFAIILGVSASGCAIVEKFASLLEEARNLYIHLYKWYNMPNTVSFEVIVGVRRPVRIQSLHF